ncbi:MAG: UDP-N-acetylmuramate--L-alanine ligase [Microgenomates bacterium 39_7]|nr:MAG: UDP-N-acetylmuramate--L-alanine ligase [Microgenomates bacterium 39_7]
MGIKGVAMTSIAQILLDLGKKVSGCDVPNKFVTQNLIDKLNLAVNHGFTHDLPKDIDCVIYTSAHGGPRNPIVLQAKERNIQTLSQAEALAYFFNQKRGVGISGVGGKSTTSAMITWILEKCNQEPSFSVGVGEILEMSRTGRWNKDSDLFIAEADEYVIDPSCSDQPDQMTPRFSFLSPEIGVCTNLVFDHPDVYHSIEHTKEVFSNYFMQTKSEGSLIYNADSQDLVDTINYIRHHLEKKNISLISFGKTQEADARILSSTICNRLNIAEAVINNQQIKLELQIPGEFNLCNALAAILAANKAGISVEEAASALKSFKGIQRRFEFRGEKKGVFYYDDYAHHPQEVRKTIQALKQWHPDQRVVVAFQPHTFSRTKQLLEEFINSLSTADEVILLDIFPSAREQYDSSINSDMLVAGVNQKDTGTKIMNLKDADNLINYCQTKLSPGDVLMTMGAGDIYEIHQSLE